MRTTLTIDDDLADILKHRAREVGRPFREVVNTAIRAGLAERTRPRPHVAPNTFPHSFSFRPGIDLDKLNQLVDELEAEAYAAGQRAAPKTRRETRHDSSRRQRPRSCT
jgi:hypothetical protein